MPTFETAYSLANEADAAALLEEKWGCSIKKAERFASVDWHIYKDGREYAVGEFKRRENSLHSYSTVLLSVRKYRALLDAYYRRRVLPLMFWEFDEGMVWIDVRDVDASQTEINGRRDRHATNDLEPMIRVPVEQLQTV